MSFQKELLRVSLNLFYGYQDLRIKSMNKIRNIVRKINEDIPMNSVEAKKENKTFDKKYSDRQLNKTMELLLLENKISQEDYDYYYECRNLIDGPTAFKMFECNSCGKRNRQEIHLGGAEDMEKETVKTIKELVINEPIWKEFLSKIKGIGELIGASLVYYFEYCDQKIYKNGELIAKEGDPNFDKAYDEWEKDHLLPKEKQIYRRTGFKTGSQLMAYTGNHTIDGKAVKPKKGISLGFKKKLRAFTWIISDSLVKHNKGYYRDLYNKEKIKQANREYEEGFLAKNYNGYKEKDTKLSKGHIHNRALRKTRKRFLWHYWEASRELIGLPFQKSYVEGVLNHNHIISWREAIKQEGKLGGVK
ncbi:MAG: hypothetical protein ACFFDN_00105 [Candidatus Hodarchaeota archaeon]